MVMNGNYLLRCISIPTAKMTELCIAQADNNKPEVCFGLALQILGNIMW